MSLSRLSSLPGGSPSTGHSRFSLEPMFIYRGFLIPVLVLLRLSPACPDLKAGQQMNNVPRVCRGLMVMSFTARRAPSQWRTYKCDVLCVQDGGFLCPLPASPECSPPPRLHVPAVLGCDVLQCSSGEGLQGLPLQQLLHVHAAARPLPVHVTHHLHHRHHSSFL